MSEQKDNATEDPHAIFSHVAFRWERDSESWQVLCAGRNEAEFLQRVDYWVGKGQEKAELRVYGTFLVPVE